MSRSPLVIAWLVLAVVPVAWWLVTRRRPDLWGAIPVPVALVSAAGDVVRRSGPATEADLAMAAGLPAEGVSVRTRSADGTPVAVAGLSTGAFVVALPQDPVRDRRDRVLSDLGARLAHDINTPLAVLLGHLDLLAHEELSELAQASVLTCQRELARLQHTANDLRTLTRLRSANSRRTTHFAGALAEEAAAGLLDTADRMGTEIDVRVPNQSLRVEVAEADLVRALRNLLLNALTYGRGEVARVGLTVSAGTSAPFNDVTFAVWDSGPGIDPADLARLCEPLVRGDGVRGVGSGLGLAIVTEVLAAHGAILTTSRENGRHQLSFKLPTAS